MVSIASTLFKSLKAFQIYGANTNVGKTVVSTIICRALKKRFPNENVWYLKPVSTGPLDQADDLHIASHTSGVSTRCLYRFRDPVSPHIAARSMGPPSDFEIISKLQIQISECASKGAGTVLLETAGGVHSPGPSGTPQVDLYRPFRLPVILIGDHRLGGISLTISAFESLHLRGYDVDSVLVFEDQRHGNAEYLGTYFKKKGIPTLTLPHPPKQEASPDEDRQMMEDYYRNVSSMHFVAQGISSAVQRHHDRIESLSTMAGRACKHIWYPFTQHQHISEEAILPIDSAHGDFFQSYPTPSKVPSHDKKSSGSAKTPEETPLLCPTFDGAASWWTQGLGHANPELSLAAAYAAGRYGHVMFASTIYEPALSLAELLLRRLDNPRLQRVFYSDNGSTGMEVALKMALGSTCQRYGWTENLNEVEVLGLKCSYHGDTIGAMDCSEPSHFNKRIGWYRGRGHWFEAPEVKLKKGVWMIELPSEMGFESSIAFKSLAEIFDVVKRDESILAQVYRNFIRDTLEKLIQQGKRFGALIMEPVLLGAGGMKLLDPLFQRIMVQVVRCNSSLFSQSAPDWRQFKDEINASSPTSWTGLPIIFDEVFTGLYRLGRFTSSSFLQVHPDISVHAKLLTGGLVPLCVTLTSEAIFESFVGSEKSDALLHGHSYTAHPVGCKVAERSLNLMQDMVRNGDWDSYKQMWSEPLSNATRRGLSKGARGEEVWSCWSKLFVTDLSHSPRVESVIALGTVLAINIRDEVSQGYASKATNNLKKQLANTLLGWNIHCRDLGNVLYLMASQTCTRKTLAAIEEVLEKALRS